jgi:hypothetical protein
VATKTIRLCDFPDSPCSKEATSYRLWREGDRHALAIDLCDEHAEPLNRMFAKAEQTDLPVKPRVKMEVTRLRSTPATRPLKKQE